jgi:glycosyltransferase involved in cell wall biosynthesis
MFVGRLVQEKGVGILLDAIPKVLHYYNDAKFIIVGKGPQMDFLKGKAESMGISNRVYFTGFVTDEDWYKLYKIADITVFPSTYEPFGIVALEGMVAGAPVVVSDVGGLGDIINHGHDGMKAYPGNANSLADSILALLYDTKLAEKCIKNAVEKVKSTYTWDIISKQTLKVYKQVVKESKESKWEIPNIKDIMNNNTSALKEELSESENYYKSTYEKKQTNK